MKIVIIDGTFNKEKSPSATTLEKRVTESGHVATTINLANEQLNNCTGCWSCWVKTPGICIFNDAGPHILEQMINADLLVHLTENSLGTVTSLTKGLLDRSIPLIHPFFDLSSGEYRHISRYPKRPKLATFFIDTTQNREHGKSSAEYFLAVSKNMHMELVATDVINGSEESLDETNLIKWIA